jgi:hypothetical protein
MKTFWEIPVSNLFDTANWSGVRPRQQMTLSPNGRWHVHGHN